MKQILTTILLCFAVKAIGQPNKYWKVAKSDTSKVFSSVDTIIKIDNMPGWDTLSEWVEDREYTNERTALGETDTIKRYFYQFRVGRTSGIVQRRSLYLEKWYLDVPKSRTQQIMDSINESKN